jgi:hypothetical protein
LGSADGRALVLGAAVTDGRTRQQHCYRDWGPDGVPNPLCSVLAWSPLVKSGCSILGFLDAEYAVAVLHCAIWDGMQRFVLLAWPRGADIALDFASRARERGVIVGLISDSRLS